MQMMIELGRREAPARERKRRRLRDSRDLSDSGDVWDRIGYAPVSLSAERCQEIVAEMAESSGRSESTPLLSAMLGKGVLAFGAAGSPGQDDEDPDSSAGAAASAATALPLDMAYQDAGPVSTASEVHEQVCSVSHKRWLLQCQVHKESAARSSYPRRLQGHAVHACRAASAAAAFVP